jgi:hypothetical protein
VASRSLSPTEMMNLVFVASLRGREVRGFGSGEESL